MVLFIFLFSALLIIASFNLPVSQCLEKSEEDHRVDQNPERRNEATRIELQTNSSDSGQREDDGRSLYPRMVDFLQQQAVNSLPAISNFAMGQFPGVIKYIYQKCVSCEGEGCPTDAETTVCVLDDILKIFPPTFSGKLAKTVVLDIIKKKGQDIYTPENIMAIASMCGTLLPKPSLEQGENVFSGCFFDVVKEMHPLQQYAHAALQTRASGYFDSVAKICHDKMPEELSDRREMNRYYLQCFINTASEDYKNHSLVKFGRRWLEPHINNPDALFNRERILDIAELCEDRTKNLSLEVRNTAAFYCFFRNILSLHPRTKMYADYLMKYEEKMGTINPTTNNGWLKTVQRQFSTMSDIRSKINSPRKIVSQNSFDNNYPQRQKDLIDCVKKALTYTFITKPSAPSITVLASKIPVVGGLFQNTNMNIATIAQTFTGAVRPCLRFYNRDKNGKLLFDYKYTMDSVREANKWNPAGATAIDMSEALIVDTAAFLAENVTVKYDKAGCPEYNFNYQNLAAWLGKTFLDSNKLVRLGSSLRRSDG